MLKKVLDLIISNNEDDIVIDYNPMHNKMGDSYKLLLIRTFNSILDEMMEESNAA